MNILLLHVCNVEISINQPVKSQNKSGRVLNAAEEGFSLHHRQKTKTFRDYIP